MGGGSIASILEYPEPTGAEVSATTHTVPAAPRSFSGSNGIVGIVGAGNFTKMTVMPVLKKIGADVKYISSAGGLTARSLAKKYGIAASTTDYKSILADPEVHLVMITTRHNLHASMVTETLRSGKHVFVEKPLAITPAELDGILEVAEAGSSMPSVTVGFNRRFSPFIQKARDLVGQTPVNIIATMNAGFIPADLWVQDMGVGGGRIIGEACHYIDMMVFLAGSPVTEVVMSALGENPAENTDNAIITLRFANGSHGVINYFSNGHKAYSKERVEVYSQGKVLIMDNFRKMQGYGFRGFSSMSGKQDKGHREQFTRLMRFVKEGGAPPIPFAEIVNTTRASFAAIESLHTGQWVRI
jgi:predicted dehydrogenase